MKSLTPLIKFYDEFCVKNFQVEELRVMNKDQEGQTFKLGDVLYQGMKIYFHDNKQLEDHCCAYIDRERVYSLF